PQALHDADEFFGIVQGLWRGWDADALLFDKAGGRFHDPQKMHLLDHKGEFFSVRGPLNVARSPQGTPVLVMSGLSEADLDFAEGSPEATKAACDDLRGRALAAGREPNAMKVLMTVAAGTELKADRVATWSGPNRCDGLNFTLPADPPALEAFADRVLPELQRRGLAQSARAGATLRQHLGLEAGGKP
ncbi:MAG: LLM class flavin-dependent oxidoreductase, partial [Mesorhizobium sp.]